MKNKILFVVLFLSVEATAQITGRIEQIYYYDEAGGFAMGPVAAFQNKRNWYVEARYNYEEARTISFYIGKVYQGDGAFSYSVAPIFGGVAGRFNGGSAGLNIDLGYKFFYFSTQSQYTFSIENEIDNFYFSWSELGYQPLEWLYAGVAIQETYFPQSRAHMTDPGLVVGLTYKRWTLPIYGFKTGNSTQAFVCSIIYEWQ